MSARRTDMHRLQEVVRLHRLGRSARVIARQLQMGRNTVKRHIAALAEGGLLDGPPDALPDVDALLACVDARLPRSDPPQ